MGVTTLKTLRQDLYEVTARADALYDQVRRQANTIADKAGELDRALNRATKAEDQRNAAWRERDELKQHPRLNDRKDFEGLTRAQLLTLIEGAINEARRKSMVEAEGLVSRHRELTEDTDLEMMRGVVTEYQRRIAQIETARAAEAKKKVEAIKLDTRPLAEKLGAVYGVPGRYVPPAEQDRASFKSFDEKTRKAAKPKYGTLAEGALVLTQGDHGTAYSLERKGDVFSCSCPAWIHQKGHTTHRTCKHLGRYLGFSNEESRVTAPQPSCWCGVILVRGQCQVHTNKWSGDERCNCGRAFWFCKDEFANSKHQRGVPHVPRLAGTPEPASIGATISYKTYNW